MVRSRAAAVAIWGRLRAVAAMSRREDTVLLRRDTQGAKDGERDDFGLRGVQSASASLSTTASTFVVSERSFVGTGPERPGHGL